jgi:D-glycero-alpha-D-manno-heptose 1-phosphate guanylyltransferase
MMRCDEVIILAGGFGTRLQSVVREVPKPLAPVAGRPFLAWVLDHLAASGMRRCILATGHLASMIEDAIGQRWAGMQIDYSVEQVPLGTGGAVAQAAARLQGEAAHIVNGDTFLYYRPEALELATHAKGVEMGIALAHVDDVSRYGAVVVEDGLVKAFREKGGSGPGLINAGCYYMTRSALLVLQAEATPFSLETEVLYPGAAAGSIAALSDATGFIDIGVPEDYARAQTLFQRRA